MGIPIRSREADGALPLRRFDGEAVLRRHPFEDRLPGRREHGAGIGRALVGGARADKVAQALLSLGLPLQPCWRFAFFPRGGYNQCMSAMPAHAETVEGLFASTRWTVVLAAGQSEDTAGNAHRALSELCRIYWRPLYLFLRRQGYAADDAQDLTQGFFAQIIRDRTYFRANRGKGRFRSFLLGALKHYVADARDREQAQKRGMPAGLSRPN